MSKIPFEQAVHDAVQADNRYAADAYQFLRDALDHTIKSLQKDNPSAVSHVSGPELCLGLRDYAIQQFGPMVPTVFDAWGLRNTRDIGEMVFNLINTGAFSRSDSDQVEDFENIYTFSEAFEKPWLPVRGLKPSPSPSRPA